MKNLPALNGDDFDQIFDAWWNGLESEDRQEFTWEHEGSSQHARFVCALELYGGKGKSIPEAYAIAFGCTLDSAKKNAYGERGLKHPAVAALLTRIRFRNREVAFLRIESKYVKLLERVADDALASTDLKVRELALHALARYASFIRMDEVEERAAKTKRAAERARNAAAAVGKNAEITVDVARMLVDKLKSAVGPETVKQLVDAGT